MRGARNSAIVAGVVLILLIVGIFLAAWFGVLLEVLYIFLMVLAAFMVVATFFQIYSILVLIRTIVDVRDEMKPLVASVQETVGIVKDTAKTAGQTVSTIGSATQLTKDFAVGPSVRLVAGLVAGQQMVRIMLGKGRVRTRAEERRKQQLAAQMEAMEARAGGKL